MKDQNNIWVGINELTDPKVLEDAQKEFVNLPVVNDLADDSFVEKSSANRRDFLKYLGFGLGAATIAAGCEIPIKRAVPYVTKPDSIVPGVATYYASTFVDGGDFCSVLVKTREGRPIKIEGNSLCPITKGGTNARAQASVLSLYDTNRLQGPAQMTDGKFAKVSWEDLDKAVGAKLNAGSNIKIFSSTNMSPSSKLAIQKFTEKYPNAELVQYDGVSYSAMLDANMMNFGQRAIPNYHFGKAKVIVSFNADFLGTWISPVEYTTDYIQNRKIKDANHPMMSRHIQVESGMSLTGSNADNRVLVRPSEQGAAIAHLYKALGGSAAGGTLNANAKAALTKVAAELKANQGQSLVVSSSNNLAEQILVNKINEMLGSYGSTMSFSHASMQRQGSDKAVVSALNEMKAGKVNAAFFMNCNPVFDLPEGADFAAAMAKVSTKVSFAASVDETSLVCDFIAPNNHYLESWGDVEAKKGIYSLVQPTISPLFDTRQSELSLLTWANAEGLDSDQPYFEFVKANWKANMFGQQSKFLSFQSFWDMCLHDGVFMAGGGAGASSFVDADGGSITAVSSAALELDLYEMIAVGDGRYANNPWLQEMADPILRTVWGNQLSVPIHYNGNEAYESFEGFEDGGIASVTVGDKSVNINAMTQFGQYDGTASVGIGYGRETVGDAGKDIGSNVQGFLSRDKNGYVQYFADATIANTNTSDPEFACVQYHHTFGVTTEEDGVEINADEAILGFQGFLTRRSIINTASVEEVPALVADLKESRAAAQKLNSHQLYDGHDALYENGHHWAMHIDLNACTGCGACTVACMSENNVPVVGKTEVHRHHEMTWLRIDRYYYGDVDNPNVVYQPMLCQHCDNAPCENVCPVAATNHSSEGLNQMTYNRCIGTRYCANNCPYKVRRFNWLDYTTADLFPKNEETINGEDVPYGADNLTRMVLNPDVTVRSRGVIEKCSFCVQRIQEGKLTAKLEKRELRDGDVKTACQTSCPTGAIIFGDDNNKESAVYKKESDPLNYIVLEEINVRSSITYTARVNNRDESFEA